MTAKTGFRRLVGGSICLSAAVFAGMWLLVHHLPGDAAAREQFTTFMTGAACASALLLFGLLLAVHILLVRPFEILCRESRIVAEINPSHKIDLPAPHLLGDLPAAVTALGAAYMKARREAAEAAEVCSGELENRMAGLETVLGSLREGVMVCDEHARIVFYNPAAVRIFHDNPALGIGRSLYLLCSPAPVENSLEILRRRRLRGAGDNEPGEENGVSFVCSTPGGIVMSCRICLFPPVPGMSWSFLFTCEDISREADVEGQRLDLLRATVRRMKDPLTGLGLGIEGLEQSPGPDTPLLRAMSGDARALREQFDVLAANIQDLASPRYVIRNVFAEDAVSCTARRLAEKGVTLTMIGDPLWVKTDISALLLLLEFFALKIHEHNRVNALEMETLLGDRRVYFEYSWAGPPVSNTELAAWTSVTPEAPGVHTVAEILEHLDSDVWSMPHRTAGFSVLRLPVPAPSDQWTHPIPPLPPRPVYADSAAFEPGAESEGLRDLPLDRLSFVVFDAETTGLSPLGGDRIVSLAGVKIVNQGILLGETFDRLVDPERGIPDSSVMFHGITDEMVRGKPTIAETLRDFHIYVGGSILVGHNAAFDMRFIRLGESAAGVRFNSPVLDTLSLSRFLHDHTPEHSLDAVAKRLGVEVRGRHTALGDSLITAQIFIRFLHLLQERGIGTLGGVMEISRP